MSPQTYNALYQIRFAQYTPTDQVDMAYTPTTHSAILTDYPVNSLPTSSVAINIVGITAILFVVGILALQAWAIRQLLSKRSYSFSA